MKISSLQENLKSGLNLAGHIAGKNANLPILNNVMIAARDGNIKLVATDLEIGIVATVRGKVEAEGALTADAKIVTEYVSLLPNQKVDLEGKDNALKVRCENYKTTIKGQSAEDFPLIPKVEREQSLRVGTAEFREALAQVIFAVSTSETRIELSGVLFAFEPGKLTLAATDSYRLAERVIKAEYGGEGQKKMIVPAKTLQEVSRILSQVKTEAVDEGAGELTVYISENQILFQVGPVELVSRLIEGQYPDYRQIIPAASVTKATLDKGEFARAIKAAAIFSKAGINDINLDLPQGKNTITITSASSQVGDNVINLPAATSGNDNGIVVNYRYLLDGVNNIGGDSVRLDIIDGSTPCVLRPDKGEDYLYVIMPIKQ
jgi:DNA polymerase-3 subunit beta